MKRNQDVNYEILKSELNNIDKVFESLNLNVNINEYFDLTCYTGKHNSKFYMMSTDVQRLTKQLIYYFTIVIKNFTYIDLYDKEFVENFKLLVKDEEEFKRFLEMISLTLDDFLHLGVYVCPNAFTSTLIKYIQTNYLNIKVVKKTKTRTKK